MSHLRESISNFQFPSALAAEVRPGPITQARKEVETTLRAFGIAAPSENDILYVYRKLRAASQDSKLEEGLSRRDYRNGTWTVFRTFEDGLPPLCEDRIFFERFTHRVAHLRSPKPMANLFLGFLEAYPRQSFAFSNICRILDDGLRIQGSRLQEIKDRAGAYGLLEETGPKKVAQQVIYGSAPVEEVLQQVYLTDARAQNGFIASVTREVCRLTKEALAKQSLRAEDLLRVLHFVSHPESVRELRIADQRTQIAESLLQPFQDRTAESAQREPLKKFFLDRFGDPRISRAKWLGISEVCRAVVVRWLVEDTFEDFMRIVDLTQAQDSDADRQWPYRRAFWMAYFKKDAISDAWLALGSNIADRAKRQLGISSGDYASLSGYGVKSTHAVLLFKIQDYVITEWSHSGKYRLWHEADAHAPRLYRRSYNRQDLVTKPAIEDAHYSPESGLWQMRLASKIRGRTNISVTKLEYMEGL